MNRKKTNWDNVMSLILALGSTLFAIVGEYLFGIWLMVAALFVIVYSMRGGNRR
jgi:hypothetical protein